MFLKSAVRDQSSLPSSGNINKDLRVSLDSGHIFQWKSSTSTWVNTGTVVSGFNAFPITSDQISEGDTQKFMNQESIDKVNYLSIISPKDIDQMEESISLVPSQISTAKSEAISDSALYTDAKVAAIVNSSPVTLDTLKELADALGDDPNFATTTSTSLGNRLRIDTSSQGLNSTQKTNAKINIDLQNLDNTSDTNKPVSSATQTALNLKANSSTVSSHIADVANPHSVTKAQVGLGNVDNTADSAKPVSTPQASALALKLNIADAFVPQYTSSTPSRVLNTAFQPSTTRAVFVCYTIEISCSATLLGGQNGSVQLLTDSNSNPTTFGSEVKNQNSVSLALAVTAVNLQRACVWGFIPPGHYVKLVSSGNGTISIAGQREVVM